MHGWLLNGLGIAGTYCIFKLNENRHGEGLINVIGPNVYWPSGIKVGNSIHIYATTIISGKQCVGRWTSVNDGPFAFDSIVLSAIGTEGQIGSQTVLYDPDDIIAPYKMWFGTDFVLRPTTIKYATSLDGLSWTRQNTVITATENYETEGFQLDNICRDTDGTWRLFYDATNDSDNIFVGVEATSTNPNGPFTKRGIVIAPEGNSVSVTTPITLGTRYLTVSSTIGLVCGHVYVLTNGFNNTTQPIVIESIISSTEILLTDGVYVAGSDFGIRPTDLRKVCISSIYRDQEGICRGYATGWSAFGTVGCEYVFDVVETNTGFVRSSNNNMPFKPVGPGSLLSFENPTPIMSDVNIPIL